MIYQEVEEALDQIMKQEHLPQAVFAAGDKLTTGFLRYFKAKGVRIPEQIALAGFSNLDLTDLLNPSLTVVRQPAFEMGKTAASVLFKSLEKKHFNLANESLVIPSALIVRGSTG